MMNKKEKAQLKGLLDRCTEAEAKARVLDDLVDFIWLKLKDEVKNQIESEVEFQVSELQIS